MAVYRLNAADFPSGNVKQFDAGNVTDDYVEGLGVQVSWDAAEQPGQVVDVPAVCRSEAAARAIAEAVQAEDEGAVMAASGPGGCLVLLGAEVPAYLLEHVTGPHGGDRVWWSIWRARVGRALGYVVLRDRAL